MKFILYHNQINGQIKSIQKKKNVYIRTTLYLYYDK